MGRIESVDSLLQNGLSTLGFASRIKMVLLSRKIWRIMGKTHKLVTMTQNWRKVGKL